MLVVQNHQVASGEQSVGGISRDNIHLFIEQRAIEQPKIEVAGPAAKCNPYMHQPGKPSGRSINS